MKVNEKSTAMQLCIFVIIFIAYCYQFMLVKQDTHQVWRLTSNVGGMRIYICDHDTSPPEDQLIKTNQVNILIRSLMLKKQKGESNSKDVKGISINEGSRKRAAEKVLDGRAAAKRAATNAQSSSRQEGSKSRPHDKDFQSLTVERLRALLKEKCLSVKGKKDELIARLRSVNG